MKLLKFTRPDGAPVWVVPASILTVAPVDPSKYGERQTRLTLAGEIQDVQESPEEVIADIVAD